MGVQADQIAPAADAAYQDRILQGVSRTFALTIPELPAPLRRVVGNAYLLCRIADTIEDEARLDFDTKRRFSERFTAVVGGEAAPEAFAAELHALLSESTSADERDLIRNTASVIRVTRGFNPVQRAALYRCVRIMSRGMAEYQRSPSLEGLRDLPDVDRYCYHVAGVVGEMLTELFCDYSPAVGRRRDALMPLSVSFGQGLQMTNILKDIWEDRRRGACWLPRDLFQAHGVALAGLEPGRFDPAFGAGLRELIGIARIHLRNALTYTLLLPAEEAGLRRFCLWALGMAVLTLRKINAHLDFTAGREVKITRRSVRATVLVTNLAVRHDAVLTMLFNAFTRGLPTAEGVPTAKPAP